MPSTQPHIWVGSPAHAQLAGPEFEAWIGVKHEGASATILRVQHLVSDSGQSNGSRWLKYRGGRAGTREQRAEPEWDLEHKRWSQDGMCSIKDEAKFDIGGWRGSPGKSCS